MPTTEKVEPYGLNKLFEALAKAQSEYLPLKKNCINPFFAKADDPTKGAYADLAATIEATRPALTKYGLAVVQLTSYKPGFAILRTILGHSSGQYLEETLEMPCPAEPQKILGGFTYARRGSYGAVVGVAPEIDDDGNLVSDGAPTGTPRRTKAEQDDFKKKRIEEEKAPSALVAPSQFKPSKTADPRPASDLISENQVKMFYVIARKSGLTDDGTKEFLGRCGYEHAPEIPKVSFGTIIDEMDPEFKFHDQR